ncbi:MAG TPA: alkaline phosphatase family protein, partial [Chloroflexota bacterium]|nr:alkaline phosphatase family protein [Chloroflexota bacterium]
GEPASRDNLARRALNPREAFMAAVASRRVLIVGSDGMRPDLVDPDLMPTFASLIDQGTRLNEHHAVYPTHTRVNISSLASGTTPGRHGVVANVMRVAGATEDGIIDTSNYQHLEVLDTATAGRALLVPTLGDLLADRGQRLAVAATSSPGAGIIWTRKQPYRVVNTNTAYGRADLYSLRDKLGDLPAIGLANPQPRLDYAARAVTDLYLDDDEIAVIVLWQNEPDHALHMHGLGSPEVAEALRACDSALASVIEGMERRGIRDQFDIFLVSDHGHSTVEARRSLAEHLSRASTVLGSQLPDLVTASDYVYARRGSPVPSAKDLEPLVRWIQEQPWAGAVFGGTHEIATLPGVLPLSLLWGGVTNERMPLLSVSPAWSDACNALGVPGTVAALTEQSALRSTHGSASPYDLHAFATAVGPDFREGATSTLATGAIDITPTILTLLGIDVPSTMDGRVLWEAFKQPFGEPGEEQMLEIPPVTPHPDGFQPTLALHQVGRGTYVHAASNGRVPAFAAD